MSFRILSAEFGHETNTFNVHPTRLQNFARHCLLTGPQAIAQRGNKNTELAGLLSVGAKHNWHIEHCFSAIAGPGGKVTRQAFNEILKPLEERFNERWDGVFLMLHGAMVTEFCDDAEGEILARVRAALGPKILIAVTLDPHANVSVKMCQLAQILVSYRTYPHVDMRQTGERCAGILQRALLGEIQPCTLHASRAMLEEVNGGRTDQGPMIQRQAMAQEFEKQAQVYAVSINGGFASADIEELGPSVLVCCEGDLDRYQWQAELIAEDFWCKREQVINQYYTVDEVVDIASQYSDREGVLVIADYADNPGAGAYGDSTNLLRGLLAGAIENACFGPLVDPQSVERLERCAIGDWVTLAIGGKTAPQMGGGPLAVEGQLIWCGDGAVVGTGPMIGGLTKDFGRCAVLKIAAIEVLLVSNPQQILDLNQFHLFNIEVESKSVVALKSMQHFRAAFAPIAEQIVVCDSGALCTLDYSALDYRNVPRPIYPLDLD